MSPFRLAILSLTRRRMTSLMAIFCIAISVACSGILIRLNQISENRFSSLAPSGQAIVGAKAGGIEILLGALNGEGEYPGFLPYALFETLKAKQSVKFEDGQHSESSSIESVTPFVYFGRLQKFRAIGTDESFFNRPNPKDSIELIEGRLFLNPMEAVIGASVAKTKKLKIGDSVSVDAWPEEIQGFQNRPSLEITGILKKTNTSLDRMIYVDVKTSYQWLSGMNLNTYSIWGPNVLNYFLIHLKPGGFPELESLINRRTVGQIIDVQSQKEKLKQITGIGQKLGFYITMLILLLGGLSVASMLIIRFEAMSLQLAVLRALGYKKVAIGQWLLWEGFLLGIAACVLGAILDALGFPIVRHLLGDTLPSSEIIPSYLYQSSIVWLTAILATTASVFVPLYRVYRQDIHFSLRS